jgi:8-oxo-dGTP diphosphatase
MMRDMEVSTNKTWIIAKVIIAGPDNKILAIRRSDTAPRNALEWDLPGGIVEYGEDPVQAVIRETSEETALEIHSITPLDVISDISSFGYAVLLIFQANSADSEISLSYEHDKYRWVSRDEFDALDTEEQFKKSVKKTYAATDTTPN